MDPVQQITLQSIDEQNIVNLLAETISELGKAKSEKKSLTEQIKEKLKFTPAYASLNEEAVEARAALKEEKTKILGTSEGQQLLEMKDEAADKVKDLREQLEAQLEIYYEKTKKTSFDAGGKKYSIHIKKKFQLAPGQQALF